jgi:hypothetical protein
VVWWFSGEYEVNEQSQPTLLDLGKPYPNATFTAVVYGDHRQKFGTPEVTLRGKRICVTGQIIDYQGKPEIVFTNPSQSTERGRWLSREDGAAATAPASKRAPRIGFRLLVCSRKLGSASLGFLAMTTPAPLTLLQS